METALSIQSHPDKELAERLHAQQPDVRQICYLAPAHVHPLTAVHLGIVMSWSQAFLQQHCQVLQYIMANNTTMLLQIYKDSNHKPEMALAITDFEALCGFVSIQELSDALHSIPELTAVVGQRQANAIHKSCNDKAGAQLALKQAFTSLMTADPQAIAEQIEILDDRLQQQEQKLTPKEKLITRLHQQYPHDVGVLSVFFLNLIVLKPGEAIYLPANEPHAYVSGQLVECMATSDNVIRAGLTPKLRDTNVLCESLTYAQGPPVMLYGDSVQEYTTVYSPPFDEFEVYKVALPESADTIVPASKGPSVLLVMHGRGNVVATSAQKDSALEPETRISRGDIFFIPSGTALDVSADSSQDVELWIAACNSKIFASDFTFPEGLASGHHVVSGQQKANGTKVSNGHILVKSALAV